MKVDIHKFIMLALLWSVAAVAAAEPARALFGLPPWLTRAFF